MSISRLFRGLVVIASLALAACSVGPAPGPSPVPGNDPAAQLGGQMTPQQAAAAFRQVVTTVEPVAERECRGRTRGVNCDFRIYVDTDPRSESNAFQGIDQNGRPEITFTIALIAEVANADELAFVMAHEAAHHVLGHLARQAENAEAGAQIFAGLASASGGNAQDIEAAIELGAFVGARSYSKDFELEADALGTVIAHNAGYDPLRGAQFFARLPDPGNRFLGTHPPNADRYRTVQAVMAQIGAASAAP